MLLGRNPSIMAPSRRETFAFVCSVVGRGLRAKRKILRGALAPTHRPNDPTIRFRQRHSDRYMHSGFDAAPFIGTNDGQADDFEPHLHAPEPWSTSEHHGIVPTNCSDMLHHPNEPNRNESVGTKLMPAPVSFCCSVDKKCCQ